MTRRAATGADLVRAITSPQSESPAIVFVNVAIPSGTGTIFTYSVPEHIIPLVSPGKRVLVPFGRRKTTGYIIDVTHQSEQEQLKDILEILDEEPIFGERDLLFFQWASRYYLYPLGNTLKNVLPSGIDIESRRWITVEPEERSGAHDSISRKEQEILSVLEGRPRGCSLQFLKKEMRRPSLEKDLNRLSDRGIVRIEDRLTTPKTGKKKERYFRCISDPPPNLTAKQLAVMTVIGEQDECSLTQLRSRFRNVSTTTRALERKSLIASEERETYRNPDPPAGYSSPDGPHRLNHDQECALAAIREAVESNSYRPFVLHGVTGSGKTEVYLKAIEACLSCGGSALFMVPEIGLTGQLLNRIRRRFNENILALFHSGLPEGERYDQWRRMQRGEARILVGTRSAVFVPSQNLRLIVVDEEHDASYKQDDRLTYNARDLAVVRARMNTATVVLGSATPDVQTYDNTRNRGFTCLRLPNRVENRKLPTVHVIDMKRPELRRGKDLLISKPLLEALEKTLEAGNQSLLLLNRRGFTTFLYCLDCGHVFTCLNCSVTMTHHMNVNRLKCHYCDYSIMAPPLCPACRGGKIYSFGAGTEKLLHEVTALFPQARTARLDSDIASKRGNTDSILSALDRREIDILVGTQMITKGHDFPHVTLVGVVSADSSLNIPDFRASERTFQILTQVAGRGGRGEAPGTVFIQTLNPDHSSVARARNHDYQHFFDDELAVRHDLGFPPFTRLINLRVSSRSSEKAAALARSLAESARRHIESGGAAQELAFLGPAECPIAKIRGVYRWQLLLKGQDARALKQLAERLQHSSPRSGADVRCDVDPVNFM